VTLTQEFIVIDIHSILAIVFPSDGKRNTLGHPRVVSEHVGELIDNQISQQTSLFFLDEDLSTPSTFMALFLIPRHLVRLFVNNVFFS
jgi:hypothetical protein